MLGASLVTTELVFMALLPVVVAAWGWHRVVRWGFVALLLWLSAELVTDLVSGTSAEDGTLSLANIGVTAVDLLGFAWLVRGRLDRARWLLLGLCAGYPVLAFLALGQLARANVWKVALGLPVSLLVLLAAGAALARHRTGAVVLLTTTLGVASIALGARSLGGFCIAAGILTVARPRSYLTLGQVLSRVAAGGAAALVALLAYQRVVLGGHLGAVAQAKALDNDGRWGILLGGRKSLFFELHFIARSPLLGNGSRPAMSAQDSGAVVRQIRELGYQFTGVDAATYTAGTSVPRHAALLDAWMTAGVLGVVPWVLALAVVVAWLRRPAPPGALWAYPVAAFLACNLVWSTFFSPFALGQRTLLTFTVVVLACSSGRDGRTHLGPETPSREGQNVRVGRSREYQRECRTGVVATTRV